MNVRAQLAAVFNLDKCIGCHTCSIACKNLWTDRRGAEYMWWNNVETRPGLGYPRRWEDQERWKGGWEVKNGSLRLRLQGRISTYFRMFFNPKLPGIDEYYEPWTYAYDHLFNAPESDDQPTARPVSLISKKPVEIKGGPNWDDDLGGSPEYAQQDLNLKQLSERERSAIFALEQVFFFYLPRICNHCLNPACAAACPQGAIYKRGEDGIVLVNQEKCRGWRMCVSGCPYKKVYYNWESGKSEKCLFCYPRVEAGEVQGCFHACVGRIRYTGILLIDADRLEESLSVPDHELVRAQREVVLDPWDEAVVNAARRSGIPDKVIESAQKSPVYAFFKKFQIAFPLHPEFRTFPMVFYVPPLLPALVEKQNGVRRVKGEFIPLLDSMRAPIKYIASLFAAGSEKDVRDAYKKLLAVRLWRAEVNSDGDASRVLKKAELSEEELVQIFNLTSRATYKERFVLPEGIAEYVKRDPEKFKGSADLEELRRLW